VLLASPSNPTGTSIAPDEMRRIVGQVRARGGVTIVDEIYLGLSYDEAFGVSALTHGDDVVTINSFSKYFSMTGWRLGWMVVPEPMVAVVEKLAQNLYICPSTVAQHAALACFEPESLAEYERRRAEFRARRDFLVPALNRLGLTVPVMPDGAFYAWADCSAFAPDSWDHAFELMHRAHLAITPGRDFGQAETKRYLRLSYATALAQLEEAVDRLQRCL
jgi:aspartate/methionine/tyrosine aminotransferase